MKEEPRLMITIDGPAGAGKTTVSKMLADRLNYRYLDTGALYRAVAWGVRDAGVESDDENGLAEVCRSLRIEIENDRLWVNGEEITESIRSPEITMLASVVSARPVVRKALLSLQRDIGKEGGLVAEGRDMGTVVFPEAACKFFLNASVRQRALRRFAQYANGGSQSLDQIEAGIRKRDEDDSSRALAPLKPAKDAVLIDATRISAEKVVETMLSHIRSGHG